MSKDVKNVPALRFKGYSDAWEKRKLGELAEFINGRAYKQDELLASGKYPVLRVGNFYTNDKWYYSNLELPEKYYAEEGDLLYTWSATFGPHIWIGPKVIYHYHIWKVALKNIFEKDFALQFFEADRVRLLNSTNGSTMIHVTKKDMESKGILLPDVYEQRTIGDLLKRVDHLIAATQDKIDALEQAKRALLQRLFDQSWRFKGYSDPWEKRKLSEVTNLITKGTTPREKGGRGEVNFIKVENLSKNGNIFTTSKVSVSEHQGYLARSILQENDILFSIAGSLGRTAIVPKLVLPANTNQALAIIRLSTGCVEFVATYLSGEAIDRYIRRNPTVGAQPNISLTQVASLQIDWPSLHEQEVISKLFARVKDLIAATQSRLSSLELLKKALLQDLFI
ncbi:restriction endonuclease subunit S [Lacticaseibacillus paracasei]|uniref:restriction endonuclease subunit S n=1 Tax=Lacticaseibacillus paracasei TaxID=1597 RepID=UPI000FEE7404|nr:restriction endonuclease subunit S [Lacticaseibacillus paracasei]MCZ2769510.1 restriction endonuclease subunit S [Lacticaseibacillus paracasei]MCZ2775047.1 restriction endonuclease subunit S [Lacticaseibacillus paracasei]MCZ2777941.1 restriction endonuclease subunit S [Lacticaseibacillus paracasei]MCZ2784162.1 restriction endonuclease subunit S [Lacticaseibacillus paracasei]NCU15561.1 restriction endonuclease subunit S [Lacticaseibacillus paracasei]